MQCIAYLDFDGNAREAMDFHARALGGAVTRRFTCGESPVCDQVGPDSARKVMHSQVEAGGAVLMGADGPPPHAAGSTCVNLLVDTPEEADRVFAALADGGQVHMPIAETFRAHRFGGLQDRYGKGWMVNCPEPMPPAP